VNGIAGYYGSIHYAQAEMKIEPLLNIGQRYLLCGGYRNQVGCDRFKIGLQCRWQL